MKILVLLLVLLTVSECARVTGQTGLDFTLTCKYDIKYNGPTEACWGRGHLPLSGCSDQLLATDGHKVIEETRVSSRYQLKGRLDEGNVSLTIMNITEEDAGVSTADHYTFIRHDIFIIRQSSDDSSNSNCRYQTHTDEEG
ncbi:Hepatitis A virus cellular receptor 1-like protein [Oryzias melastigma]|uniref:Hepatitis A virus cellular receptor 1-like protein n=1 Tax=Oryzias melastigma TaxID=30732 RepID=A0A834CCK5_ORYME|nr:Hepatitis A virus cellular receptor 1-like protein [Oryzias melastigma]